MPPLLQCSERCFFIYKQAFAFPSPAAPPHQPPQSQGGQEQAHARTPDAAHQRLEAQLAEERRARTAAEAGRRQAEEAARTADTARQRAEAQLAEERRARTAAEAGRRQAEARAAAAERELAAVRASNPPRPSPRQLTVFSRDELEAATHGFVDASLLGQGGFGSVYRAEALPSLTTSGGFAVKRLATDSMQGGEQLRTEVQLLGACQHEALLPLVGFCLDPDAPCLVYPLMVGGNLEDRLTLTAEGNRRLAQLGLRLPPSPLAWQARVRAARDVTRALAYLHTAAEGKTVLLHRDIKPANVLLDSQLNAKLADVGLARASSELGPGGQTHLTTRTLVGTPGFIDPLYTETGTYSTVTDGYALGISILMCLGGRPAVGLLDVWADALEEPSRETVAPRLDRAAAWPDDVAVALTRVVIGLSWQRTRGRRMTIDTALRALEAAADDGGVRPGVSVVEDERECVVCLVEPRGARFTCGHCVCCAGCASILQTRGGRCPVCRNPIRGLSDQGDHLANALTFVAIH